MTAHPHSAIDALAESLWDRFLELSPTTATAVGDHRWDDRLADPGPHGRERLRVLAEEAIEVAAATDPEGLDVEDRITLDMLGVVGDLWLRELELRSDRLDVVDQIFGPQTLPASLTRFQQADTPEALDAFEARLRAYPAFMAANAELVREGLRSGLTAPRIVAERLVAQVEAMLAAPVEEDPVVATVAVADDAGRRRIEAAVRDAVRPGLAAFLEAIRGRYLDATRTEPGLWSAPDGDALYRLRIRHWTTLDLDPAELHRSGVEEMDAIEAERRAIARAEGFGDDTRAYRAALDERFAPSGAEEILEASRRFIERASAAAPAWFPRVPRSPCVVMAVEAYREKDTPPAHYYPPSPDGSRPGIFYANTYDARTRPLHRIPPIAAHEAIPGHHFQIALEVEDTALNRFRRLGSRLAGAAFAEGWGLYTERLADEMGLYDTVEHRFAMLDMQSWRAARLVVDTGIHALRWSRDRGVETMLAAGLSRTDAEIETDRYIVWPGQALSYKVGQREIERLRRLLEARDGDRFDLRAFHGELLGHGSLPLATLARELPDWVRPRA